MANFDIYAAITDRIIAELENGIIPWHKPWTGTTTGAISRETGRSRQSGPHRSRWSRSR